MLMDLVEMIGWSVAFYEKQVFPMNHLTRAPEGMPRFDGGADVALFQTTAIERRVCRN